MIYIPNKYLFAMLDDIYHSNSADEMRVKADLHNVDLNDIDVLKFLIDTTSYHRAFWPHTAKRFTALKALLRSIKQLSHGKSFEQLIDHVNDSISSISKWSRTTPGGKQHIKILNQVIKILSAHVEKQHS